jgi:hypothetical protein
MGRCQTVRILVADMLGQTENVADVPIADIRDKEPSAVRWGIAVVSCAS